MQSDKQTALITGASSGIGYELSKVFAAGGFNLILVARNQVQLETIASGFRQSDGVNVAVCPADLSKPAAAQELYDELQAQKVEVDVLVNNAGFGLNESFTTTDMVRQEEMIRLNITALVQLCRLFGADMENRGSGKILNVASTAAFQPGPFMSTYYASKAYVLMFTEALHTELKPRGVLVSTLCPGPTKTGFFRQADMQSSFLAGNMLVMPADKVARAGYRGLIKGKRVIIPGLLNKAGVFAVRFFPRSLVCILVSSMNRKRGK
ncbi:MAG: SDR family oxidoreductase [Balneolales bacterium]